MRIDGVSEGKPAQSAGMKAGDVVIQMGDHDVEDMMGYMKALGKFEKGQSTIVKINRSGKILDLEVVF
jgi:S1-C subfamily serine protease